MKPKIVEIVSYYDNDYGEADFSELIQCCDSASAILTDEQLAEWLVEFREHANHPEASEYCDDYTATMVFDIDDQQLVCVVDSGGEVTNGEFQLFCEKHSIDVQAIVDTLDFTGVAVSEMYTGMCDDHPHILELINKITN